MMSKMRMMKPTTPPPVPNFQALPWELVLTVSEAIAMEKRQAWSTRLRERLNIVCGLWRCEM